MMKSELRDIRKKSIFERNSKITNIIAEWETRKRVKKTVMETRSSALALSHHK